jgi:hypothetical protein
MSLLKNLGITVLLAVTSALLLAATTTFALA